VGVNFAAVASELLTPHLRAGSPRPGAARAPRAVV